MENIKVVTICSSMRFSEEMQNLEKEVKLFMIFDILDDIERFRRTRF